MHIKELQLLGFKSFADKTTLRFSEGMSAIIGPNGCGKTNVLDALRWVLGEQSFALLRCAKNEDLIFGGTAELPATNYAEVKLILGNDTLPQYGSEIEIKRRYFRSGESEYYLNRQACRLRDIQEVFLASGVGTKAYSIFDLRQMREIIAGNIRKMFEEAATLAKYRDAKADCQRKLDLTDRDMVRLDDIMAERERVVRSLRRQAGKLTAYDQLKEEEKGLRLIELKAEFDTLSREFELLDKDTTAMEQAEADRLVEIRRIEEELHRQRGRLRQEQTRKDVLAQEARDKRRQLAELESGLMLAEQKAGFLLREADGKDRQREALEKEVAELETVFARAIERLAEAGSTQSRLEEELDRAQEATRVEERRLYERRSLEQTVRENLDSLLEKQHEMRRDIARIEAAELNRSETRARLTRELEEARARQAHIREELVAADRAVGEATAGLTDARGGVEAVADELRRALAELDRVTDELVRARERRAAAERELAVLRSSRSDSLERCRELLGDLVTGGLGEFLDIEPGWESACEAALQPVADAIVTARMPAAEALTRLIESGPDPGCSLAPADDVPGRAEDGDAGRLAEHVKLKPGAPGPVRRLLAEFLVVATEAELVAADPGRSLVTRGGCARFADGRLVIAPRARGRLRLESQLREKSALHDESAREVEALTAARADAAGRLEKLQASLEEKKERVVEMERRKSSCDATRRSLTNQRDEVDRDVRRQQSEVEALGRTEAEARPDPERGRVEETAARAGQQSAALKQAQGQVAEQEQVVRQKLEQATALLAELNEARQAVSRLETESSFAKQALADRRRRAAELAEAAAGERRAAEEQQSERRQRAPEVDELRSSVEELESRVDELRVADLARVEEELEGNLDQMRREREQSQALLMEQRIRKHELNQRQAAVVQEARDQFATDIARFEPGETAGSAERLAQVRARLEALGRVNPLARDEYEQERRDLERVTAQRADVGAARENLLRTMEEIDKHARERFVATYQEVRTAFQEVFRQLFLEGEADLVLGDEANPLESEIGITARPRGKNPKRLEQLSDGEKALLAVSLLFAFYRVKPAPFCFLDEIDAPLDDANVGRFADYLKDISHNTQVIIITHNRLTVERAEVLFGVTAERPGVSKLVSVSLAEYESSPAASAVR